MKKKIAIITLVGNNNYGNRLQNYALAKKIESMGYDVDTIWKVGNYKKYEFKNMIKRVYSIFNKKYMRYNKFLKFTKTYLNNRYISCTESIVNDYYKFVAGSDQVWNYSYKTFNKDRLLLFSNYEKNLAYSASIGLDTIDEENIELFKKGMKNIKYLSVREDRAKEMIEDITGRSDIEVLLDPTMLLSSKEWDKIARKPKRINNKKYILNYFLGELSGERKKEIERIAKDNNCEIINLLDENSQYFTCDPSEFLYLEKNAFLICTDSFHSSVFAIIYDRPFIIFDRKDNIRCMNSRIKTLLSKFKLDDRMYNGKIEDRMLNHDYTNVFKILKNEKEKSEKFLRKSLGE